MFFYFVKFWLVKSEPTTYSWQQMQEDKIVHWDGVRNYQARNNLRAMQLGDQAFFYHSNKEREIKGVVRVVREAYPDHTDESGKFDMVDLEFVKSLPRPISLQEIKSHPFLQNIALIKQSRLSVMPITENECHIIMTIANYFY